MGHQFIRWSGKVHLMANKSLSISAGDFYKEAKPDLCGVRSGEFKMWTLDLLRVDLIYLKLRDLSKLNSIRT